MAGWYLSEQARHALRTARALARERQHAALGPPHLLAAVLRQWGNQHAGGPALLRACGLTAGQATNLTVTLLHAYDHPGAATPAAEPRPNPALRLALAHAHRIAALARAPYVGTEHLVVAMLWLDDARELRRQGISYQQAAEQLATLPAPSRPWRAPRSSRWKRSRRRRPPRPAWPNWPASRPSSTPSTDG